MLRTQCFEILAASEQDLRRASAMISRIFPWRLTSEIFNNGLLLKTIDYRFVYCFLKDFLGGQGCDGGDKVVVGEIPPVPPPTRKNPGQIIWHTYYKTTRVLTIQATTTEIVIQISSLLTHSTVFRKAAPPFRHKRSK